MTVSILKSGATVLNFKHCTINFKAWEFQTLANWFCELPQYSVSYQLYIDMKLLGQEK